MYCNTERLPSLQNHPHEFIELMLTWKAFYGPEVRLQSSLCLLRTLHAAMNVLLPMCRGDFLQLEAAGYDAILPP